MKKISKATVLVLSLIMIEGSTRVNSYAAEPTNDILPKQILDIILKDGSVAIAKLMQCFPLHFFSNLSVETSRFYIRMTKPFRYSRERHPRLIQGNCPRPSETLLMLMY